VVIIIILVVLGFRTNVLLMSFSSLIIPKWPIEYSIIIHIISRKMCKLYFGLRNINIWKMRIVKVRQHRIKIKTIYLSVSRNMHHTNANTFPPYMNI
jgi:hypothetical protein